jgi:hypothetical protein
MAFVPANSFETIMIAAQQSFSPHARAWIDGSGNTLNRCYRGRTRRHA